MTGTKLEMVFLNESGRSNKIVVDTPRGDLTEAEVQAAMQTIIDRNIFSSTGGNFIGISSAQIVTTDTTEIIAEVE